MFVFDLLYFCLSVSNTSIDYLVKIGKLICLVTLGLPSVVDSIADFESESHKFESCSDFICISVSYDFTVPVSKVREFLEAHAIYPVYPN